MRRLKLVFPVLLLVLAFLPFCSVCAADGAGEVQDLTKAFEIWKDKGIVFAIRENGKVIDRGVLKLESWAGESRWTVRNSKGHFLTHGNKYARGKVENWKNGKTKLVIRTDKGHLITHININLTSRASFAANVVGLRRLQKSKYLSFVQETIAEVVVQEMKQNYFSKARALLSYLQKYHKEAGVENFRPVLRIIQRHVNFAVAHGGGSEYKTLETNIKAVSKML